jgi:UDP-glucose:(heptosyl)LPS alpha-1,3-glucosyltransferase
MKIALGIYRLSPRGGLEDNCIRIATELEKRGHSVMAFVAGAYPALPFPVRSLALPRFTNSNHGRQASFARAFVGAAKGTFDRTVAFQPIPGADVLFLADTLRDKADTPWMKRLTRRFGTYAALERGCFEDGSMTRIIGLAEPQMQEFIDRYPSSRERIAIIPPTPPYSRRKPELRSIMRERAQKELGLTSDDPVWLWLGLQPHTKGLDRVIKALTLHKNARLLIGGLDSNSRKVKPFIDRARRLGVIDRIQCLGYISDDRFFAAMAAADILVHPARVEVTGGVILEALVNGLPVVTTSVCGFAGHITRSGAGKVLDGSFDEDAFSQLIGEAYLDPTLSSRGITYGADPQLYSGIDNACDLIEAERWKFPKDSTFQTHDRLGTSCSNIH